jgi:hypothetical protein
MAGTKRRSSRQVAKRSIYAEPDTDDEDFEFEYNRRRSTESHEPNDDADADADYNAEPPQPAPKRQRTASRRKPQTRSSAKGQQSLKSAFRIGKARKPNSKSLRSQSHGEKEESKTFNGPSDGKIPDWTRLEINTLKDIFIYATLPADDSIVRSNTTWLFRAARTCRAFAQPALEAYYQSPALHASSHLHDFLAILEPTKEQPYMEDNVKEQRYMDYNVKVKRLDIDVRALAYLAPGKSAFDLSALTRQLPQLQHMEIHHADHVAPFRPVKIGRYSFNPEILFQAMDDKDIRLRTWRWSRNLISNDSFVDLYGMMSVAHQRKMFASLKRLVVCGFNVSDSAEPVADEQGVLCYNYFP